MKKALSLFLSLLLLLSLTACGGEKVVWEDLVLGSKLPEPPAINGKIHYNSAEELWLDINDVSSKQFNDYIEACKEKGFTIEAESDSYSYDAFNQDGYKLNLTHYGENSDLDIKLEAPMEMSDITWPTGSAGKKIPAPKSTVGKFSYEYDDNFFVYIGGTSKTDYADYVQSCSDRGFNIDYQKGDKYYRADNKEGWHISIEYIGNNIMTIHIDPPEDEEISSLPAATIPSAPSSSEEEASDNSGIDPDFKAAMDSYESFMDEYVAFMKKYQENPTDLSLLTDYANYMSRYAEVVEDFEKWDDQEMNTAETAYYIEVQSRVSKKLLEAAQ